MMAQTSILGSSPLTRPAHPTSIRRTGTRGYADFQLTRGKETTSCRAVPRVDVTTSTEKAVMIVLFGTNSPIPAVALTDSHMHGACARSATVIAQCAVEPEILALRALRGGPFSTAGARSRQAVLSRSCSSRSPVLTRNDSVPYR